MELMLTVLLFLIKEIGNCCLIYWSSSSQGGVTYHICIRGRACHFWGLKFRMKAIFLGAEFSSRTAHFFGLSLAPTPIFLGSMLWYLTNNFLPSTLSLREDNNSNKHSKHPYFWVRDVQYTNNFGSKLFNEPIFLGLNLTLHTHTPVYKCSKYPPCLQLDLGTVDVSKTNLQGSWSLKCNT